MNLEDNELVLSQLVDGELPVDAANQVLLEVLDHAEQQQQLRGMLQLRQALAGWRQQQPQSAMVMLPQPSTEPRHRQKSWHLPTLAAAVLLGGALVTVGFLLGGLREKGELPDTVAHLQPKPNGHTVTLVSPEQRLEIARAFALHESVAGPLGWYVADDANIQVAPLRSDEAAGRPIALMLRLTPVNGDQRSSSQTYVIVCRNHDAATIELPSPQMARTVCLRLVPSADDGKVKIQYALAASDSDRGVDGNAVLTGRRDLGMSQLPLGQLAFNDRLVSVDASAWVMPEGIK